MEFADDSNNVNLGEVQPKERMLGNYGSEGWGFESLRACHSTSAPRCGVRAIPEFHGFLTATTTIYHC